jgi:hypothetical protein
MSGELDLDRLRKLCGMFSSAHDGEIANAARMADRLVRAAGLAWGDVLRPSLPPPPREPFPDFAEHQRRARAAQARAEWVRRARAEWEQAPASPPADEDYAHWRIMFWHCANRRDKLSARELEFLHGLARRTRAPTERQMAWLTAIYGRVTA